MGHRGQALTLHRGEQAIDAADRMAALVKPELLGAPGLTVIQNHLSRPFQFRVRFERWDEILEAPEPPVVAPFARAIRHYARGRALAAKADLPAAASELERLRAEAAHESLQGTPLEFNAADAVLAIAVDVLAGHIAAARGDYGLAIDRLRAAAAAEDALVYGEPPEWSVPVRQELGLVLLKAGRAEEAAEVFREDLERFPENDWSLEGLRRSLKAADQEPVMQNGSMAH